MIANTGSGTQIDWHGTVDPRVTPRQIYADGSAVTSALTVAVANQATASANYTVQLKFAR